MQDVPNLNYIKELSGDNDAFEQKFIGVLKEEFPEEKQDYESYIANRDMKAAAEIVHKLKHKFNILSMENAYRFAVNYEEDLLIENSGLHSDFILILKQIETYLKTI